MRLGIIGYGNMGRAFARALKDVCELIVYDISPARREEAKEAGIPVAGDLYFLLRESETLMLAVKPKDLPGVLADVREELGEKMLISIAAGVEIAHLREMAGGHHRIVRMMPNLGVEIGKGTIAVCYAEGVGEEEKKEILKVFSSCGKLYEIPESLFDSFTALAGSGPAFVFSFIEALALAGVREGFSYEQSLDIVLNVVGSSAELVRASGEHPDRLIKRVASPGGTTIEGLAYLERKGFRGTVIRCVEKTSEKAKKLRN
jgi:pyrroline-5-carboxylate reductase